MRARITESTAAKIASVILSYFIAVLFVFSTASVGMMVYYKFYFSNEETVKREVMTDMADNEAIFTADMWYWSNENLSDYYSDKNVYYEIFDIRNQEIAESNFENQPYIAKGEYTLQANINKSRINPETGEVIWYSDAEDVAKATVYVAENMTMNDRFSVTLKIIEFGFKYEYFAIIIMIFSLGLLITLWSYSFCAAGHSKGGKIRPNFLDKVPFDICTAIVTVLAVLSVVIVSDFGSGGLDSVFVMFLVGSVDYFIGILYLLSLATRIKTKSLIKNNIIYYVLSYLYRVCKKGLGCLKYIFKNLNIVYKTIVVLVSFIVVEIFSVALIFEALYHFEPDVFIIIIIFVNIVFILIALYLSIVMQKIKHGGEKIAGGDLQHKIDTQYMFGDFKEFSESINNINEGLQNAVNERMKSERFKTELITNVSHDIKTPLTSIINYVDLIKKEDCENKVINEYIEVLDRQSGRLKKLVEDLVEASKASTGNLSVSLMPCDVSVLLSQVAGEFEDKLSKLNLTPVVSIPENAVSIMADGRHLWRVFDNLMNNICKYAMSGTRVYMDVKAEQGNAIITFRNISKYELNISADELMERFVRGDSSRNTEGSGLGLSIAKSLVEIQNGNMFLEVDGDLFKVTIVFPLVKKGIN